MPDKGTVKIWRLIPLKVSSWQVEENALLWWKWGSCDPPVHLLLQRLQPGVDRHLLAPADGLRGGSGGVRFRGLVRGQRLLGGEHLLVGLRPLSLQSWEQTHGVRGAGTLLAISSRALLRRSTYQLKECRSPAFCQLLSFHHHRRPRERDWTQPPWSIELHINSLLHLLWVFTLKLSGLK